MIVPTRPNPWQPTVPNTLIHIKRQQREKRPPKWPPKKRASQGPPWLQVFLPPPVVHKRRLAVLFVAELVGRSSCWAGVCIFNNVPLANVSTVAPAPVSGKPTSLYCHTIPVIHTHALGKDSGASGDLPVSFVTMNLSGRTGVNGWKFSDLWTCTYVAYLNTLTTELLLRWTWVSWSATN